MDNWVIVVIIIVIFLLVGGAVFAELNTGGSFAGTLQQVTDSGATTTNLIYLDGGVQVTGVAAFVGNPTIVGDLGIVGSVTSTGTVAGSVADFTTYLNMPAGSGTPGLQAVTDIGNHTTNSIDFAGGTVTATLYLDADLFTDRWANDDQNTVIGINAAGDDNMTGDDNSLFGYEAGKRLTSGQDNTFVGRGAGRNDQDGDSNVCIGRNTGYSNISGYQNTFLGAYAGSSGTDVDGSVFIGFDVGSDETTNDKLYIDNSNTATPLIWGDFDTDEIEINGSMMATDYYSGDATQGATASPNGLVFKDGLFTGGSVTSGGTQNLWATFSADAGSTTADTPTDTFTITGGAGISTTIVGDEVTIAYTGAASGTPNLQQVTDIGNTTTNPIQFAGGTSTASIDVSGTVSATAFEGDGSGLTGISLNLQQVTDVGNTTTNGIEVDDVLLNNNTTIGSSADGKIDFTPTAATVLEINNTSSGGIRMDEAVGMYTAPNSSYYIRASQDIYNPSGSIYGGYFDRTVYMTSGFNNESFEALTGRVYPYPATVAEQYGGFAAGINADLTIGGSGHFRDFAKLYANMARFTNNNNGIINAPVALYGSLIYLNAGMTPPDQLTVFHSGPIFRNLSGVDMFSGGWIECQPASTGGIGSYTGWRSSGVEIDSTGSVDGDVIHFLAEPSIKTSSGTIAGSEIGLKIEAFDNSIVEGDSWGIYNESETYLGDQSVVAGTMTFEGDFAPIVLTGSAMVWKCLDLDPANIGKPNTDPPAIVDYQGFKFDAFDDSTEEQVYYLWHLPSDFAETASSIRGHFGMMVNNPQAGTEAVVMGFEYKLMEPGDVFDFTALTSSGSVTTTITGGEAAYTWHASPIGYIDTTGFDHEGVVMFRFYRYTGSAVDDYTGDAWLGAYHLEYLSDKLGEVS